MVDQLICGHGLKSAEFAQIEFYSYGITLVTRALEMWAQLTASKKRINMASSPNSIENYLDYTKIQV